ncbi:MmgE/PrpD family protein [Sphingobium fuliginis]|uniref:MmgE/PrpD family protein n=1 Tax=Sphingobium fuliginis ATCC 27551 TaxID=1208342 RepID=A0A5B8CHN6_SPHSA|nr:MmgE/PrpD family protein [Sphingobium fuliginis]QDC38242.1 MmgE/PrpD family protein [Sphingobium fuliginis ATCC 27551]
MNSLTARSALYLQHKFEKNIPPVVSSKALTCIADYIASCLDARSSPSFAASTEQPVLGRCLQFGEPARAGAEDAAFSNAMRAHWIIRDDIHVPSATHIGSIVISAMLALAESECLTGRNFVHGVIAGYEMMARLGTAVWQGSAHRHFRPSGLSGPFGVAAAAIIALSLDERAGANALGIAANMASGLNQWPWSGGEEAAVHMGMAARSGLTAVALARLGLSPSPDIIEGEDGFLAAYAPNGWAGQCYADLLNDDWEILRIQHKPVAGCNLVQTPVAAALELRTLHQIDPSKIREIVIETFPQAQSYPGCDSLGPFTSVQQAKMSLQYAVALALLKGTNDEAGYCDFHNPQLLRLISATRLSVAREFDAAFPHTQPVRLTVKFAEGSAISRDMPDVPWLLEEDVWNRLRTILDARSGRRRADEIVRAIQGLESADRVAELTSLFDF